MPVYKVKESGLEKIYDSNNSFFHELYKLNNVPLGDLEAQATFLAEKYLNLSYKHCKEFSNIEINKRLRYLQMLCFLSDRKLKKQ